MPGLGKALCAADGDGVWRHFDIKVSAGKAVLFNGHQFANEEEER